MSARYFGCGRLPAFPMSSRTFSPCVFASFLKPPARQPPPTERPKTTVVSLLYRRHKGQAAGGWWETKEGAPPSVGGAHIHPQHVQTRHGCRRGRGAISTDSRAAAATRVPHPPFCGTYSAFQSPANSPYMGSHAGGESRTVQEQRGHNQGR